MFQISTKNLPYRPINLLSENEKTNISFNFPIPGHCNYSTPICRKCCYFNRGYMRLHPEKKEYVSNYFLDKNNDLLQATCECRVYNAVRIAGGGETLLRHVPNLIRLAEACPNTKFYGMTRDKRVAKKINGVLPNLSMMVSVDASSPKSVWDYDGKMCFGPRRAMDTVPNDPRILIVFPYHCGGKAVKGVPRHDKDCLAVWKEISGCMECQRCWNWEK